MLTQENVINFLRHNPALTVSTLEKEAAIPKGTIAQTLAGTRNLSEKHLTALFPILSKYGYSDSLYEKARVISIINHKGGVGKTTTTSSLGEALARRGFKVLLIDLDPQGNLSQILGIDAPENQVAQALLNHAIPLPIVEISENLFLSPSDIELADAEIQLILSVGGDLRLKNKLQPILGAFDYVLIDCPPNLGFITRNGIEISDYYLIPTIPDTLSTYGIPQIVKTIHQFTTERKLSIQCLGLVITKFDSRSNSHDRGKRNLPVRFSKIFSDLGLSPAPIFETVMPQANATSEAMEFTNTPTSFRKKYGHSKSGDRYLYDYVEDLAREFMKNAK